MKAQLTFINFVVPSFQFDKKEIKGEGNFNIIPRAIISRSDKQFHINIELELEDIQNSIFVQMLAVGIFNYDTEEEESLLNFMSLNGPAIVFPYIRSFISSFTSQTGFETVTLPTLNLSGFKDEMLENLVDLDEIKNE
jgi:preprotein translocase subunit SecB